MGRGIRFSDVRSNSVPYSVIWLGPLRARRHPSGGKTRSRTACPWSEQPSPPLPPPLSLASLSQAPTRLQVTGLHGCVWVIGPARERPPVRGWPQTQWACGGTQTRIGVCGHDRGRVNSQALGAVRGDVTSVYPAPSVSWGLRQAVSCLQDNFSG